MIGGHILSTVDRPGRGTSTDHPRGTRSPKEPGQAPVPV